MDKVVFMTGIATSFDAELALAFLRAGDRVIAAGPHCPAVPQAVYVPFAPLCEGAGEALYQAVAGKTRSLDYFIDTSSAHFAGEDRRITDGLCPEEIIQSFRANTLAPIQALEALLPLLDAGTGKRLAFISTHDASVNWCGNTAGYGPSMAKAALHNILQVIKNKLFPDGYTFRVYDPLPGESRVNPVTSAAGAYTYITRDRAIDGHQIERRNDEKRLVMRDALGREWPW